MYAGSLAPPGPEASGLAHFGSRRFLMIPFLPFASRRAARAARARPNHPHSLRAALEVLEPRSLLTIFQAPQLVVGNFGFNAGGWRVDQHPRLVVDVTGDNRADIVGFGKPGGFAPRHTRKRTFPA